MTEYVLTESEKLVEQLEIWLPISHLFIQQPFIFGKITFRAVTKTMVDDWEASLLSRAKTPKEVESVKKGIVIPGLRSLRSLTRGYYLPPPRGSLSVDDQVEFMITSFSTICSGVTQQLVIPPEMILTKSHGTMP
jgi:hypothetical protein